METVPNKDLIHLKNKMRNCQSVEGVLAMVEAHDAEQALELKEQVALLNQALDLVTADRDKLKLRAMDLSTALEARDNHITTIQEQIQQWRVWAVALVGTTYLDSNDDECLQRLMVEALKGNPFDELVFDIEDSKSREKNLEKPMAALLDGNTTTPAERLKWVREYRRLLSGGYQAKVRLLKDQVKAAKDFPDAERKKFAKYIEGLDVKIKEHESDLQEWQLWADSFLEDELETDDCRRNAMSDIFAKCSAEASNHRNNWDLMVGRLQSWHKWADGFLGEQPVSDEERHVSMSRLFKRWQAKAKVSIAPKLSEEEQRVVQRAVEHLESRAETTKAEGTDLNTAVEQDILDVYFPGMVAIIERVWPEVVFPKLMDDAQLLKFLKNSERDSSYLLQRVVTTLSSRVEGGANGKASHHP
jgi:hypothetical protein